MEKKPSTNPTSVEYHFIKSNDFRVVHCDGVWGGATPRGLINMNFYSERSTIPQKTVCKVLEAGHIGPEIKREGKEGIIREIDFSVILDVNTAKSLLEWLKAHIDRIEAIEATKHLEENTNVRN